MTRSDHPGTAPDAALALVDQGLNASLERLFALLRIPSVSTQPEHAGDCRRAAEFLRDELAALGLDAAVRDTPGLPIVVAHDRAATEGPHVLFYGHYDVQPVDPLALWTTDPFEPVLVDGPNGRQIVARGASDDKGQVMTFLEALRAIRAADGHYPLRISILLEGEEESGGPSLRPFLDANREELRADFALICDTGMLNGGVPAVTTMLRGMVGEEITIRGADRDLHSGMFGNAARNPIAVLADILSDLRDAEGRVTLPGFYDGVTPVDPAVKAAWERIGGLGDADLLGPVGLSVPAGEAGFSALEQVWTRPTCEINGITGGYTGKGFKTVLPAEASAKVSFRLVAGQDPERIRAAFRAHVEARIPADCSVAFHAHGGSRASALPAGFPPLAQALAALTAEWGKDAAVIGSGGSIPVVRELQDALGIESLLIGFGLDDDRIHSPNEKYDLESFHRGTRSWVRVLYGLASA